jgi:hypothetical protein
LVLPVRGVAAWHAVCEYGVVATGEDEDVTETMKPDRGSVAQHRPRSVLFSVLTGLTGLVVVLQGVWAGIFLEHDGGREAAAGWIDVHARGADLAILLALVATSVAVWRLRSRQDLWVGSIVLLVLLLVETYIGGVIRDAGTDVLTAVHVPLAMVIMGLVVWLPLRSRHHSDPATP